MTFLGVATGVLNPGKELDATLDRIAETGADGIRALAQWPRIEPALGGKLDITSYLPIVDGCAKRGLALSAGLSGRDGTSFDYAPQYATTAAWLARQLEGRCSWFEFVNEPDLSPADKTPSPARYMELHKRAYDAIKAAAPAVQVMNGGLAGMHADWAPGKTAADFWAECYALGIHGYLDAAAFHPYSGPGTFAESVADAKRGAFLLKECRATSVKGGDKTLPWVLTEFSWATGGNRNPISERDQAARLADAYHWIARRPWIAASFWFTDLDHVDADPSNVGSWMGLYHVDGTPKVSVAVFQALSALEES